MPSPQKYGTALQYINLYIFSIGILLATTCSRLDHILGIPWIKTAFNCYLIFVLAIGCFTLAIYRFRTFLYASACVGLLLLQSFAYLYQPSLHLDVPVQDWLLADSVSSNYSFNQVWIYLRNLSTFIIPVLAINASRDLPLRAKQLLPLGFIGTGLLLNSVACLVQGFVDLEVLAQGSGTAVAALRAAGLLEDSGASTVYFAMMVSGLFAVLLISRQSFIKSLALGGFLLFVTAAGAQTSGRIFFVGSFLPIVILSILAMARSLRHQNLRSVFYAGGFFLGVSILFFFLVQWKMRDTTIAIFIQNSFSSLDSEKLNRMLTALDPVRSTHWRVMLKTFLENPVFGAGLGSFYANLQEHSHWASQFGGSIYLDPPASFYLMLISELGLLGILIVSAWIGAIYHRSIFLTAQAMSPVQSFYFGCFLSLACSFLIGIHFLFVSISSLIGLIVFASFAPDLASLHLKSFTLPSRFIRYGFVGCAALSIGGAYFLAPRPPAFRWLARGKPQVPLSVGVPIQAPGAGTWLESGAEVLLTSSRFRFFVELPSSSYPLHISIKVRDELGKELAHGSHQIENYALPKPGRFLSFRLPEHLLEKCFRQISLSNYCSVAVETNPSWHFGDAHLGFFVSTLHLDLPLVYRPVSKLSSSSNG